MARKHEARTVEVRAEALEVGDVVVSSSGATWQVERVQTYRDRDGRQQVTATGHSGRGTPFALQRRAHQPVRVHLRTVTIYVETELAR